MEDANIIIAYIIVTIVVSLICGWIGYLCGSSRQRGTAGLVLGLLFGPIGCIVALFLPRDMPTARPLGHAATASATRFCSLCGKHVDRYTRSCPECGNAI